MKYEFDQKRADRDAILYNTDGRLFDLVETTELLELRSRPNAFSFLIFSLIVSSGVTYLASRGISTLTRSQMDIFIAVNWLTTFGVLLAVARFFGIYEPKRWILDKRSDWIFADAKKLAPLSSVSNVRCFKMGRRLKLVLILKNGREFHVGSFRFGHQEWAWRQDAAQIAAFLGVPLEIPPL